MFISLSKNFIYIYIYNSKTVKTKVYSELNVSKHKSQNNGN